MEQFILLLTEKKKLGWILIPYMVEMNGDMHIKLIEQIHLNHVKNESYSFTKSQEEVISILDGITDQKLHKIFGKQKSVKEFLDQLEPNFFDKHIRPKIEKAIHAAFEIASIDETPIFNKGGKFSHIYPSDRVRMSPIYDQTNFVFELTNEGLNYSLQISTGNKEIRLLNREVIEITINPANLLIGNRLFRFQNIDSKKFRPFVNKHSVMVPARSVPTYMKSFVLNCVKNHRVKANGFELIDKATDLTACLHLERDLAHEPVFTLKFKYGKDEYLSGDTAKVYASLEEKKGQYTFYRLKRDLEKEAHFKHFLIDHGLKQTGPSHYLPKLEDKSIVNIIEWLNKNEQKLRKEGFKIIQNSKEDTYYTGKINLTFSYEEVNDWFDLQMIIETDDFTFPFHKLRRNILLQKSEYRLPNGEIFIIPQEWLTKYSELMHFAKVEDDKLKLDKIHFNLLNENQEKEAIDWKAGIDNLNSFEAVPKLDTPQNLKATLRPYQTEGFSWMYLLKENNFGGVLADDMGLGKTIQTISLLTTEYNVEETNAIKVENGQQLSLFDSPVSGFNTSQKAASLIVMPTSLVHNWVNEIKKFAPHLKTYIYTGAKRLKSKEIGKIIRHYHVVLTSYGIARNDVDFLGSYQFNHIILDESQNIKNPTSKIYQAISSLKANHFLALTGTPIENSLTDLWAQMNFVNNGLLGSLNFFKNHYVTPIEKQKNKEKAAKLKQLIGPFILRRTKDMVATELPPITEQVLYCDMTKEQAKFYEKEKSGVRNALLKAIEETGVNKNAIMALQALTKLRQIANHPVFVDEDYKGSSGKYEQIFENLNNIISENHKVLIFSSFVKDLHLLEKDLKKKKQKYSILTGTTQDREKMISDKPRFIFMDLSVYFKLE